MTKTSQANIRSVTVYGSARAGTAFEKKQANGLGRLLAAHNIALIFGGGSTGLMGEVARGCGQAGGRTVGVTTIHIESIEGSRSVKLTDRVVAANIQERRKKLLELGDAAVVLPGGVGTLEELFEIWSGLHLKLHAKPIAFLNGSGFWTPMLDWIHVLGERGYVRTDPALQPTVHETPDELITHLLQRSAYGSVCRTMT